MESSESTDIRLNSPDNEPDSHQLALNQELKPVDRGRDAWTVLIAGFVFEALFWGFPSCFGVFQDFYSKQAEFEIDAPNIPLIGTLAQGLFYLGTPLSALLTRKFPRYRPHQIWIGWPCCVLSLVGASFASSVQGLIWTQGVLYGLGFVTLTLPIVSMLNEWWIARKGMAFGLISASSGVTGAALPPGIDFLLRRYGHRTTLRACAILLAILTGPLIPLFKGRLPASRHTGLPKIDLAFLKTPLFWVYGSAVLAQGIGFFIPSVFLPSYATSVNISSNQAALLLTAMSIAQVLGQFAFGYMSDRNLSVGLLSVVCCAAASVASSTLWGLGTSVGLLAAFGIMYGFFGFGFGTMRVAMARAVDNDPSAVFSLYAIFVFLQGIGNVLVAPLSAALLSGSTVRESFGARRYAGLIILTSATSLLSALIIGLWHSLKWLKVSLR